MASNQIQAYGKKFPLLLTLKSPKGQVELQETVGKGNYGYVYRGKLIASNQQAAIKVVFLKEDEIRETLLEMEILAACNHPTITRYMGCFIKGMDLWICMEFCGGGALDTIYRASKKPLTEEQIGAILYDSLSGLDYLHRERFLIHRDIKAGNIFFTESGYLKLGDFGVSAQLSSAAGRASTFIGTPYWMAPEVILTDPESPSSGDCTYDSKADIWSIGITAIEIAEKNPPLSDIHPMRALYLIPKSDLNFAKPKNFTKPFQDFVNQCLIKDPLSRPSAEKLLQHAFFAKTKAQQRTKIIGELIAKIKKQKENKNAGFDEEEDDEDEEEKKVEVPLNLVSETLKLAKQVVQETAAKQLAIDQQQMKLDGIAEANAMLVSPPPAALAPSLVPLVASGLSDLAKSPGATASLTTDSSVPSDPTSKQQVVASVTPAPVAQPAVQVAASTPITASKTIGNSIASLHDKTPDRLDFKGLVEEVGGARRVLKSISITNVLKMEVLTSDVLDNTYALLGTSLGLFFVDLTKAAANPTPIPLIRNIRFRQIEIVPQYNIMIALSGKHDQVRQYKLSSIRKLIKLFTGTPASELISKKAGGDMANYDINDSSTLDANKVNGAVAGPVDNAIDDEYKHLHTKKLEDDHVLVARWTSDYIKIVGSKDARVCVIQHTETSVFMGVLFKQDVTLYQWAKEPYLKFMKLRAFWLPEAPKSMHLIHDGLTITDLYLIYASEANIVSVDDSKVKELFVNPEYTSIAKSIKGVKNPRWQTFNQIPFHDVKRVALRAAASSGSNTVNRKLAAVAGKLMVDATNGGNQDRFFLSTYHSHTKVVDITAQPITGAEVGGWKNGVTWPDAPSDLVLRSMDYVISICKNTIVIADWITAQVIQEFKLEDSASMRVIGTKSGAVIVCVDRKKKGSVVYYLREPPVKPMTLPNTTTTAATATATATAARDSTSISPTSPQAASVDNELNTEMSSLQMSTQGSVKK